MTKFGIFLGRLQPFHLGHQAIIDEIIADGLYPIILVGGVNKDDERHPYNFPQISHMISLVYPPSALQIKPLPDYTNWDEWYLTVLTKLPPKDRCVIYTNNKEQDRLTFNCKGKPYCNTFYSDLWQDNGYTTKQVTLPTERGVTNINATEIRDDLLASEDLLAPPVFEYLLSLHK